MSSRTSSWKWFYLAAVGGLAGAMLVMDLLALADASLGFSMRKIVALLIGGAVAGAFSCCALRVLTVWIVRRLPLDALTIARFLDVDLLSYLPLLSFGLGAVGIRFAVGLTGCVVATVIIAKAILLLAVLPRQSRAEWFASLPYLAFLFFISGFAALIYQIVWQRVLFADYGVNIESITIVVSLFMFGLGVGSLIGGALSRRFPDRSPQLFLSCELLMGLFGLFSIPLIHRISAVTLHGNLLQVSAAIYALLCVPTILMGATLPILVSHLYRHYRNVGKSVGMLYCINTLGSAVACFATAEVLFVFGGEQSAVAIAAACNISVGVLVHRYATRIAFRSASAAAAAPAPAGVFADDHNVAESLI